MMRSSNSNKMAIFRKTMWILLILRLVYSKSSLIMTMDNNKHPRTFIYCFLSLSNFSSVQIRPILTRKSSNFTEGNEYVV